MLCHEHHVHHVCFSIGAGPNFQSCLAIMVRRFGEGDKNAATKAREIQTAVFVVDEGRLEVEIAATKVRETQKADYDVMQHEVQILQSRVQILENRLDAHLVPHIEKADLVGDKLNGKADFVELEEKDAQGDYEQFARYVAEKRVQDSKSITEKNGAKAEAEVNLVKETKEKYGKPVTFCERSRRWRDAQGRYCRPPSPAAPASFAR